MNKFVTGVWAGVATPLLGLILGCTVASCGGGDAAPATPPPPISVSVTPDAASAPPGTTVALTASLQNDSTNAGVTWTISPASGAGTLSNETATSVTYNAPASPPSTDTTVTITATSKADASQSAATTITVPSISVTIDPSSVTVQAGSTQALTATVPPYPIWSVDHSLIPQEPSEHVAQRMGHPPEQRQSGSR